MMLVGGGSPVRDKGETIPLFHAFFEFYMVACGLVYNLRAWDSRVIYWTRFLTDHHLSLL